MIPVSLSLRGFLSYSDPVEIDFRKFDLACISGANGSGKSSLLDAVTWVLFGEARRRDDTVINSHCNTAAVILEFVYEQVLYQVQRTKTKDKATQLEFLMRSPEGDTWKSLTQPSVRETEAYIRETLRMDYETFINASFFLQGKADQFSQQRPGDRKRVLGNILGLEIWESYRKQAAEMRRKQENDLAAIEAKLAEIQQELNQEGDRKNRLAQLEEGLEQSIASRQAKETEVESLRRLEVMLSEQRRLLEMLRLQSKNADLRWKQKQIQTAERESECMELVQQEEAAEAITQAYQKWLLDRQELQRWEEIAARFHKQEQRRAPYLLAIESARSHLESEKKNLLLQETANDQKRRQIQDIIERLDEKRRARESLTQQIERRKAQEQTYQVLSIEQASLDAENRQLRSEMKELKERMDRLGAAEGSTCPLCDQPLPALERENLIVKIGEQGKACGIRFRGNQERMKEVDSARLLIQAEQKVLDQIDQTMNLLQRQTSDLEAQQTLLERDISNWESEGIKRLAEIEITLATGEYASLEREKLEEIDAELRALGYDPLTHEALRQREQMGREYEQRYHDLEKAHAMLTPLKREVEELKQQMATLEHEARDYQEQCAAAQSQVDTTRAGMPDLEKAEREYNLLKEKENIFRQRIGSARQEVEVLNTLRDRQKEYAHQRITIASQIDRLQTLERAFGKDGVPALLIESALPEIEIQANRVLDNLTDGTLSLRFSTQKKFRDKNRDDKKETLEIMIGDAAGQREYELFSGGEAFRVNFALRLALARVLAQRAGARLQTLVIDEGFGSQDAEGRQRLIEAINLVRHEFAKILVITHMEEMKDAFPARLEVEKTSNGSRVSLVL